MLCTMRASPSSSNPILPVDESLVCSVAFVHKQRQQAAGEAIAVAAVGWESGENGRPAPRVSDMRGVLDSRQLMAQVRLTLYSSSDLSIYWLIDHILSSFMPPS